MIGMNQSFNMEPATITCSKRKCVQQHIPPCRFGEMSKEQQAVVARYREHQDAKSKSVWKVPGLVYSAKQRRALELVVEEKCPIAQHNG